MKTQIKTIFSLLLVTMVQSLNGQTLFSDKMEENQSSTAETSLFSQNEGTSFLEEEDKHSGRFSSINLNELRRTILNEMIKDGLIGNKKERIYLFLREEGVNFNNKKLDKELNQKYIQLLAPFDIGSGPYRTVFLSKDCTAVGDFREDAFHGKMQGRLRIEYTQRPFEF